MSKDTIYREDAILAMANALWHYPNDCYKNLNVYEFAKALAELGLRSLPSAQPDTIPLDWIQKYADDWEDMSYAYDNPILGMLEDWRREQE